MKKEYWRPTHMRAKTLLQDYWAVTLPLLFGYVRVKPARWMNAQEKTGRFLGLHFSLRR